jgi:hypothetical protein
MRRSSSSSRCDGAFGKRPSRKKEKKVNESNSKQGETERNVHNFKIFLSFTVRNNKKKIVSLPSIKFLRIFIEAFFMIELLKSALML